MTRVGPRSGFRRAARGAGRRVGSIASGRTVVAGFAAVLVVLAAAPAARAADRIYWTNSAPDNKISWANLDGSGGGALDPTGATASSPMGVAIDPASGRIYWTNAGSPEGIFFANLSGGGGGGLSTSGATLPGQFRDLAIRPASPGNPSARIYWTRFSPDGISSARLDGSGDGDDLATGDATTDGPQGVAIRPATGSIYWANMGTAEGISLAALDDSGVGRDLLMVGPPVDDPFGVAINEATGRVYWANLDLDSSANDGISFVNPDGTGGDLDIAGATIINPTGVAIDPDAGRIYWINSIGTGAGVSFANLSGGGGGDLNISGATIFDGRFAALLKAPKGTGAPQIAGGSSAGSVLSCTMGSWAADLHESRLYRAPASISFQWSRDGADIPGAISSTHVANAAGVYRCRVAATNHAGTSTQTSAAHLVTSSSSSQPSNQFTLGKLLKNKKKGIAFLLVNVPGPGELGLAGKGVQGIGGPGIARKSLAVAGGEARLRVAPAKGKKGRKVRSKLRNKGKAKLRVRVTYVPSGGTANTQAARVKLVKK